MAILASNVFAQQHGIEDREPNLTLKITELPPDEPGLMRPVRVFPQLSFSQSILLLELVDPLDPAGKRFFHVSQSGIISVFPHLPDPAPNEVSTFLNISNRVLNSGEQGLLGLAFDPDFFDNGTFYVYYSADDPRRSVISRFRAPNPRTSPANPASEEVLLEVLQPFTNHKAGMIAFGPDKMLYIALGDGGSGGDPENHGQDTTTLLGSILRIDVRTPDPDDGLNYVIPPDNPFYGSGPDPETRKEIYAYGVRNPYRFSFDRQNGFLYAADVGQNEWEEIDIIRAGGNYGWRIMEGNHCFNPPNGCDPTGLIPPIAEYSHNGGGASVTGGYVYYGREVPELYGAYLFADFITSDIYALRYDGETVSPISTLVDGSGLAVTGFGQDSTGEVYLLNYFGGVYVLRPAGAPAPSSFPTRLSDLPALLAAGSGQGHTVGGVIPYEPSAKRWSDGADNERFFALPDYAYSGPDFAQMTYRDEDGWDFPDDTVIVKNFLLSLDLRNLANAKRIETQLLYKHQGEWHGFSYEWNEDETDAVLLTSGKRRPFTLLDEAGQPFPYNWTYSSRSQCQACHTAAANKVLGLNTPQMNHDFLYPASGVTDNQLRTLDWIRLFDAPLPGEPVDLPRMPDPADPNAWLEDRARAYLAANCSSCHRPGGTAGTPLDLRWGIFNEEMNAIDEPPTRGDLGIPDALIIKPGEPDASVLLARMSTLDPAHRMPPLASSRVDEFAVALVRDWIISLRLPAAPPPATTIIAPLGTITNRTPTYTWNSVPESSWYYLWVDGPRGSVIIAEWYEAREVCSGATCAVTPPFTLEYARHSWRVQTWNAAGDGPWSTSFNFTVNPTALPGAATLIAPSGDSPATPTFTWNAVENATFYFLTINRPFGAPIRQMYAAVSVCEGGVCAVTGIRLNRGPHTWSIQTWNPVGFGPLSAVMNFVVTEGEPPVGVATLLRPSGITGDPMPTYAWTSVPGATQYFLWVNGPKGVAFTRRLTAATVCNGGECSVRPNVTLSQGQHHWWIQASNAVNVGPWSPAMGFYIIYE